MEYKLLNEILAHADKIKITWNFDEQQADPIHKGDLTKAIKYELFDLLSKANQVDAVVNTILAENKKLKEEVKEYNDLIMLQHKRIVEANKYWQEKLNKPKLLHSDLGNLLKFLMDRIDDLETINS